jgi:hypothetical protein
MDGSPYTEKHLAASILGPPVTQIVSDRFPDIGRQRQNLELPSFAANAKFTRLPVDVLQLHFRHFAGPQS